jgi:hypothetical protein
LSSNKKGERGKIKKNRKLGKGGNIKRKKGNLREKAGSQLSKESTFKSFLILN